MDIEILRPFGPSVVKIKIPQDTIDEMNLFVDEIINDIDSVYDEIQR